MPGTPHAPGLGIACPHCAQTHMRCIGHYDRADGPKPCGRNVEQGRVQCYMHGGERPSSARKWARKRAIRPMAKAMTEVLATLDGLGIPVSTNPIDALVGQLAESSGVLAFLRVRVQTLTLPEADSTGMAYGPEYRGQAINPLLALYNEERDRNAKLAELAHRAGVQDAQVQIMVRQAELFAEVLRRVLDDTDLGLSDTQRSRFLTIAAGQFKLLDAAS